MNYELLQRQSRRFTTDEAAEYLGLKAALLYRLRRDGGGPRFFQIGRVVRYDQIDLDLWIEANKRLSHDDEVTPR